MQRRTEPQDRGNEAGQLDLEYDGPCSTVPVAADRTMVVFV